MSDNHITHNNFHIPDGGENVERFIHNFKEFYQDSGKYALQGQVPFLAKLAEYYECRSQSNPLDNWTDVLKVM